MNTLTRITAAGATAALIGLAVVGAPAGATPATETETYTVSDSGFELDPFSTSIPRFDPSLGTLLEVRYSLMADARAQICLENLSLESGQDDARASFDIGLTVDVPGLPRAFSFNELDTSGAVGIGRGHADSACTAAFDETTFSFPSAVAASNLRYRDTGPNPAVETGTLTTDLDGFIGTEPLEVIYNGTSVGSMTIGSEWESIYTSFGAMEVEISYVYAPPVVTTTTVAPTTVPETTEPPTTTATPTTTVPAPTTTLPGRLPQTGGESNAIMLVAGGLVLAGLTVVSFAELRRRRTA